MSHVSGRSRMVVAVLAALALGIQGCAAETPTEPETSLDDVTGTLEVFLTGDSATTVQAESTLYGFQDEPVAFFIAGPSRHTPDRAEYRHRSEPQWYEWGSLSPWVWEEEPEPPPEPDPEPELEEVHVWISGVSTEMEDGTRLSFNEDVGDVDLMTLDGTTIQMVDVQIPAGTYKYIAFRLDPAQSYVIEGGEQKPLSVPAEDVRVDGPFDVNPNAMTSVTLHFDTEASLTRGDDGSWSLDPVVQIQMTGG